ncbi:MAG: addiction module protein [Bryobacteraceae bacterium]|jgi:hypothetical protein
MARDDDGVEEAWREEVRRRIEQIDSGAVRMIPWDEAYRRLRAYDARLAALRTAIDEGDASGIAEDDVFARVRRTHNLHRKPR